MEKMLYKTGSGQPSFSEETAIRGYEPERPYPQNPSAIVYRTRFMQLRAYYSRPIANTPHPYLPQVFFADDIEFQDRPGGVMEWTRVYVTIPDQWNDFESDAYNYPGYQGTLLTLGRNPFTRVVTAKTTKDYYLVGQLIPFNSYINSGGALFSIGGLSGATGYSNSANIPACAGGQNYAGVISANAASSTHYYYATNGSLPFGFTTASVFVKGNGTNKVRVDLIEGSFSQKGSVQCDLTTGQTFGTIVGNGYGIESVGDGWWRINVTGNCGASSAQGLVLYVLDSNGNDTFAGTGQTLNIWRPMVNNGNAALAPTIPPTLAGDGVTNYPITSADQVPQKFGQRYFYSGFANGAGYIAEFLSDGGAGLIVSDPTLSNYKNYVITDQGNTNSYSIESDDSSQTLWYGTVWERNRKFVKAR